MHSEVRGAAAAASCQRIRALLGQHEAKIGKRKRLGTTRVILITRDGEKEHAAHFPLPEDRTIDGNEGRYKERLQTKYLKAPANKISSVGTCCRFVTVSIDDFSDCSSVLSRDKGGVSPVIFHDPPNHNSTNSSQKPRKRVSKEHACFSKQMIQKQIRREYVAAVEKKLKQHPLAMFPHYKDHMTPELFEKVVSVLDPDMSVNSASALPTPTGAHVEEENEENYKEPSQEEVNREKDTTSAV
ncbi:protein FAM47E [Anoplopoma fimbria]|uniref:protein FAM47E n=1 Tax=Anoplopoma fimbria TaxID=229290 RepID=UPI0023EBDF45|nr:protein FAM47E [Anoplopoma fimbria]